MKKRLAVLIPYTIALITGAIGGIVIKRVIMAPDKKLVGFNPDLCKPNAVELISKIEAESTPASAVKKYPAVDIVNYALEKYKTYENSVSIGYGVAETVVNQMIRNAQIKIGDKYFEESISKSTMVGVGKRMIQEGKESKTLVYNEKSQNDVFINGDTVATNFKPNPDSYTNEEYKEAWGRNLPDIFIYCVHENTIIDQTIEQSGSEYKIQLKLNPDMGGYNYRFQMNTISKLDSLPVFEYITLNFTLKDDLQLKHLNVSEKYKAAKLGVAPDIKNTIDYDYFPGLLWQFPALEENVDYKTLRGMIK